MKEYRFFIAVAVSAGCHAAVLLLALLPPWRSYTPASLMLRGGDNAVTTEFLASVEAVAGPAEPSPTPVTQAEQALRRQVETAAEQLAAAVRELGKIKLPDPPKPPEPQAPVAEPPPEPQPPVAEPPLEPQPPVAEPPPEPKQSEPFIEPVIEATREQIDRSATNLAERMRDLAQTVREASRQCAARQAGGTAARQNQAEQVAHSGPPAGPAGPAAPHGASANGQARGYGNAAVNSRASNGGSGTQGVSGGTQAAGALSLVYPPISRRRGEEGSVILQWQVLARGRCGWVRVVRSSGYQLLDQAAVEAVKNAAFRPAASAGRAVDSVMACTFRFTLSDQG